MVVVATSTGKLFVQTASTDHRAIPGQANTVSAAIEPVINPAKSIPPYVRGAIAAFLNQCLQIT